MVRRAAALALAMSLGLSGAARAGIYTDDLSKCLVKATTEADRLDLIIWIYGAMSVHPAVKSLSTITDAQRDASNHKAGDLLQRLLLQDCHAQTVDAIRYEGSGALQASFSVLGQVAMVGLMQDKTVLGDIQGIVKYVDNDKFAALGREANPAAAAAKK